MTSERHVDDLFDLTGRVVLITGAGGYLGSAMCRALVEAGATVIASSRSAERAQQIAAELEKIGGNHFGIELDHMDPGSIDRGFDKAVSLAGHVDILINNGNEGAGGDLTTVTAEQFNRQLQNATGFFLLARRLHDHLGERSAAGNIILIGSMYGVVGSYPDAYEGICDASPVGYHALKGGIVHMTRHLAAYWASDNIRVNCLSPGPFPNPESAPAAMVERLCEKLPMKRMGNNHELKGVIVFLASDASSYMTGQNLIIDGGWTAW
ncbi:MAG: SDR family oxidoreductase [Planctomycetota bacterium]|nr:SDR family oxidoreductase [Planctomycetota bacterium]